MDSPKARTKAVLEAVPGSTLPKVRNWPTTQKLTQPLPPTKHDMFDSAQYTHLNDVHQMVPKPTTGGVLDIRNQRHGLYHAVIPRRSSKSFLLGAVRKNIGVVDSFRVRFRILSISGATSPVFPASSASAPAKDTDDASNAGDVAHAVKEHLEMKEIAWK